MALGSTPCRARASKRGIDSAVIAASAMEAEDATRTAVLVAGPFEHDAAVVRGLRDRSESPALLEGAPKAR
jgi:hypothetical protein